MTKEFEGKTALVTGGASGIGAAIVKELAAAGANVVVADLEADAARQMADAVAAEGGSARPFALDVADPAAVQAMVDFAVKEFGGLNLAVNNAGIGGAAKPTADYTLEDWKSVIDVNLNGVFYCMKAEIPAMLEAGGGSIVNMSSILGTNGFATASAYVTAKHGLVGLTKTSAIEYSAQGIRINAVGPGFIETPLLTKHLDAETLAGIAKMHPIGRLGRPEEVSALAVFLLSDRSSFITGSYHLVDGAYAAQ